MVLGLSFDAILAVGMTVLMIAGGVRPVGRGDPRPGRSDSWLRHDQAGRGRAHGRDHRPVDRRGRGSGQRPDHRQGARQPVHRNVGHDANCARCRLLLTAGYGIPNLPDDFNVIGQGMFLGLQNPVWVMLAVVIIGEVLLRRAKFFRQSYFIGGNERSARLSGINVDRVKILNYVLMGVLAAVAGMLLTARMGTASVSAGLELRTARDLGLVIGGASLAGGEGSVLGSLLGVLLMALLQTASTCWVSTSTGKRCDRLGTGN